MGTRPFILTIISSIIIYGVMLSVYASNFGERWADWYFAIWAWAVFIFIFTVSGLFAHKLIISREKTKGWQAFFGFMDLYLSVNHALAALGMSIFALDTAPGKATYIAPVGNTPYAVFYADFLSSCFYVVNSAGHYSTSPVTGQAIGATWGMLVTITGLLMVGFVFVIVIDKRIYLLQEQENQAGIRTVQVGYIPDYGGVFNHGKGNQRRSKPPGPNTVFWKGGGKTFK